MAMGDDDVRRSQHPGFSCGGPAVSSTPFVVDGQGRRWLREAAGSSSVAAPAVVETGEPSAAPSPPAAPAPPEQPASSPPPAAPPSFSDDNTSVIIRNVTVENSSALDCSLCCHPLKSPIFQCSFGHVVCSPCHDNLSPVTKCHVCRDPTPAVYFRCNAMEQALDSIRVPPLSFSNRSSVVRNVTVENSTAFDCTICYHPLKPPIFQCSVGHVACSRCNDKLRQAPATRWRCHVCRAPTPRGYSRCKAMEQVVEAIHVPCPHAAQGCAATPAYHDRDAHAQACAHWPCRCPVQGCGFAGSVRTTLPVHLTAVHGWPCSIGRARITHGLKVRLRKGFNVVVVASAAAAGDGHEQEQYTLVLNVEQAAPVCNAISALCIHPSRTGTVSVGLYYYRRWCRDDDSGGSISRYQQSSQLDVVCTDLSNGMPGPSSCCLPFLVPRSAAAPGGQEAKMATISASRSTTSAQPN